MKCVSIKSMSEGSRLHFLKWGAGISILHRAVVFEDSFGNRRYFNAKGWNFTSESIKRECDKAIGEYLNGEKP